MIDRSSIEELCRNAAMMEADDLPSLVAVQEAVDALAQEAKDRGERELTTTAEKASAFVNAVLLRETDDTKAALENARRLVGELQALVERATAPTEAIDAEILAAWVSSAGTTCDEASAAVVALPAEQIRGEAADAIKRTIHTFKGELGVLGLGAGQKLCHRVEECIAERLAAGAEFPVDAVLGLLDWIRAYAAALAKNANAPAPDAGEIEAELAKGVGASSGTPASVGAASTTSDAAKNEPRATFAAPSTPASQVTSVVATAPPVDAAADDGAPVDLSIDPEMRDNVAQVVAELKEHLAGGEQAMLGLEEDPTNKELMDGLFRAFHTIKGVASFLHLTPVVEVAHTAESLLDEARTGRLALTAASLDLTLRAGDLIGQVLTALSGGPTPTRGMVRGLVGQLRAAAKGETAAATASVVSTASVSATNRTDGSDGSHEARASAGSAGVAAATVAPVSAPASPGNSVETKTSAASTPAANAPAGGTGNAAPNAHSGKSADTTVKVSTARMDALIDLVGELVIAHQMVVQHPTLRAAGEQRLQRNVAHAGKIVRDLQAVSMSLRMIAVKGTFQKMARLVRDVAAKAGRKIEFRMEGEDTELDRTIVDQINDPLVHVIRNACDHGIEPPEVRVKAGKSAAGTVTTRAFHQGGEIVVEVTDDGRGLNREKIVRKAVERGLIAASADPATLADAEVFKLTFLPGFSTAEKVTDISGRGVGMDVVRRNIEALRGKVEIRSKAGEGTTISMRLPLTMAIIDGMVVRVGAQRYVVPTLAIEQSFRPKAEDVKTVHGGRGEMVVVRGAVLPVYRLHDLFDVRDGKREIAEGLLIVLDAAGGRCCLFVDEILGQHQVVIKRLGAGAPSLPGIAGGAILGDGRVALILDPGVLVQEATRATE